MAKTGKMFAAVPIAGLIAVATACGSSGGPPDGDNDVLNNLIAKVDKDNSGAKEWWEHVTDVDDGLGTDGTIITDYSGEKIASYRTAVAICQAFTDAAVEGSFFVVTGEFRLPREREADGSVDYDETDSELAETDVSGKDAGTCRANPAYTDIKDQLYKEDVPLGPFTDEYPNPSTPPD